MRLIRVSSKFLVEMFHDNRLHKIHRWAGALSGDFEANPLDHIGSSLVRVFVAFATSKSG